MNLQEAIVEAGAVRRIIKHIYKGGEDSNAISVLLELSNKEILREKIGNAKDCIPLLVSLLQKNNPDVSEKARMVLENLSSNTHFVVKMAEAGHFQPFVVRFNQGKQYSYIYIYIYLLIYAYMQTYILLYYIIIPRLIFQDPKRPEP